MKFKSVLIANRGEIALRISRAASEIGIRTVGVYSTDDADSLHVRRVDEAVALPGRGVRAYLDIDAVLEAAASAGAEAIHPGYGFLAESAEFARRCADAGITFIGPKVEHLELFGHKGRARASAIEAGVPVMRGIDRAVSLEEAAEFFASLPAGRAMMVKAIAGGGGRGSRVVSDAADLEDLYARCQSEALMSFGSDEVYVEEFMARARHIEVQVLGDAYGKVAHLGERECSLQRRHQKVIEMAPAPGIDDVVRGQLIAAALKLARYTGYSSAGTFEFLLDVGTESACTRFVFIEANARLQVEHTVTEEVTGFDIATAQIRLAQGATIDEIGLGGAPIQPRGYAIQARVNLEVIAEDGSIRPGGGLIQAYEPPGGPGVRVDGFGYAGYRTNPSFDPLLAKVIVHSGSRDFVDAVNRLTRALRDFRLGGIKCNIPFLQAILTHEDFLAGRFYTRFVDDHLADLVRAGDAWLEANPTLEAVDPAATAPATQGRLVGGRIANATNADPLALFDFTGTAKLPASGAGRSIGAAAAAVSDGDTAEVPAPMQGTIISIDVNVGDQARKGQQVAVIEAMKMEHVLYAGTTGHVYEIPLGVGDIVYQDDAVVRLDQIDDDVEAVDSSGVQVDPEHIRQDLQEVFDRKALTLDENRKAEVDKRHSFGYRTPRENIAHLLDEGSFKEYWQLVVARRRSRHDEEALKKISPADGLIGGTGSINGDLFDDERSRAMVVSYDYTVLAGTQGGMNHYKQDRLYELCHRFRIPLILFAEGGGGRPGDDKLGPGPALDVYTFVTFSKLSGLVPVVGITNGRCFAGNTALLACSDVIIATESSTTAMGGPAMIEGGGLGMYTAEELGPPSMQSPNGVIDILVKDEVEAVDVAKKYLSYFQGPIDQWETHDQRLLRHVVPEGGKRLYQMRDIINLIADVDSVLEIRRDFGIGIITSFIRVEGRPMGVVANNPHHIAGAIDSDGADKAARFMQLCDAFDIPVLSLIDCPGMMVGPEVEATALVRHCARLFNVGSNMTSPLFTVAIRKAYGLGAQAMFGASTLVGFFAVAWPSAEFAGMNIEGMVKLGYRKELQAIEDPDERLAQFQKQVDAAYEAARAVNVAVGGGIDDVIDPAETRDWLATSMRRLPPAEPRTEKKYPFIDTW